MDVIFCRNALMYFAPQPMRRVIDRLHDALVPGGWLAVAPSETSAALFERFTPVNRRGSLLYRRPLAPIDSSPAPPRRAPAPRAARAPDSVVSCAERARLHADLGEHEQALAWCDRWAAADLLDPEAHYLRAAILFELERHDEARTALQRSLFLQPEFVLAHYALGSLAARRGDQGSARRHYVNALHLLSRREVDELVPGSDGLSTGRLAETIGAILATASGRDE
jgi:chemotaxis protein methyltransferase CheR